MHFAYPINSYDDRHQGSQMPAAEYAAANGLVCLSDELENKPNLCAMDVQQAPPPLVFVDALTLVVYNVEPVEFVGTRPDPRR